jgi:hypothetical protein
MSLEMYQVLKLDWLSEDPSKNNVILKLKKSLYGMKKAPGVFNGTLTNSLVEIGFRNIQTDVCVFVKVIEGGIMILTVYVDDILIFG